MSCIPEPATLDNPAGAVNPYICLEVPGLGQTRRLLLIPRCSHKHAGELKIELESGN